MLCFTMSFERSHWRESPLKIHIVFISFNISFSYSVIQHQTDTNTVIGFGTKKTKKWHSSLRVVEHPNNHIPCPFNIMCTGVSFCDVRFLFHRRFLMGDHHQINCCIGVKRMIGREPKQVMVVLMEIFPVQVIRFECFFHDKRYHYFISVFIFVARLREFITRRAKSFFLIPSQLQQPAFHMVSNVFFNF